MRLRSVLAVAVVCFSSVASRAATVYPVTGAIALQETSLTVSTVSAQSSLWDTQVVAQNTGLQTLQNVYLFSLDPEVNGTSLTLTSFGTYTGAGGLYATAENPAVLITRSETDASIDRSSAGSATSAEIPGFLIADTLLPGQSVAFDVDFTLPSSAQDFGFDDFVTGNAVTPEPSSLLLLGTGLLGVTGLLRKRVV